jgi:site-specific DNA recombinase
MKKIHRTKSGTGRVVGYIRVSSQGQVADGESLERQEEKIRAYCSLKGISDVDIIADRGISGFKSSRPGFQKLISMCSSKEVRMIIVNDLSRLSRSVRDTLAFVEDVVNKYGVEFVSLQNDIDTTSPMGKAFLAISAVFNQLARDEVSMKVKNMWAHKRSKNEKTGGCIPFGYSLVDSKRLVPLPEEQETVKHIHDLRASGHSLRDIVSDLHGKGIKTKTGREKWNPKIVKQILDRQLNELAIDATLTDTEKNIAFAEVGSALSFTDKIDEPKPNRKAALK